MKEAETSIELVYLYNICISNVFLHVAFSTLIVSLLYNTVFCLKLLCVSSDRVGETN